MSRQTPKLQIFFMEVNFQFTKAYNIPDTRSIQSLLRLTDTVDVGGVNGTIQHFCQKMKSHLPVLSNVKWLMYHRSPDIPSQISDDMQRPAKNNNCLDDQENLRYLQNPDINPLKPELNPICYLLALLGAYHFLHVSRMRVKSLTLRLLMSYIYIYIYIYMEHPFLMFLDHTQRRSTVGRTPLDE